MKRDFLRRSCLLLVLIGVVLGVASYFAYQAHASTLSRSGRVWSWLRNPGANPDWAIQAGERCDSAPFLLPTDGFIGFLWDDSFRIGHRHQGLDIFGGSELNLTPVVAVYPGYLTRMSDWKSSVIIRIPDDPLKPGRQIWTYYTHMADPQGNSFIALQFPPGASEVYVEAGALLGYQGNYSGDPGNPTGVHLHFSIVLDDGQGKFRNELEITNTLDPSPYLGIPVSSHGDPNSIPVCNPEENEG